MINAGQTQPNLFAAPGDTTPVVFEPTSRLSKFNGGEIWIGAMGASDNWGGCNILASQDGTKYLQIGTIESPARLGTLQANFASGSDPDTTDTLIVNMEENSLPLEAGTTADADQGNTLCYVDGEIIAYSACAISGQDQYTMGTYIRRGQMGTAAASHPYGSQFLRLDDTIFQFIYDPSWAGQTIYLKFQSFNHFGNSAQDTSTLTPLTFTIPGLSTAQPPAQTTALVNGDFEASAELPPYGWVWVPNEGLNAGTPSYDTATPYAGLRSLVLAANASFVMYLRTGQKYIVTPGDTYRIQAAMKADGTPASSSYGEVSLYFYDVSGTVTGSVRLTAGHTQTSWTLQTGSGVVPAGTSYAYVFVGVFPATSPATYEFDSISLIRAATLTSAFDVAGTLPIANVAARSGSITYVIDGAGSVVSTGVKGQLSIPNNCTITGWVITADQSGSAVVDVLHSTYSGFPTTASIAGTDKPTLSSAQKNQDSALSGWGSTALTAGDILQFQVDSCSACTRLIVTLNVSIIG